MDNPEAVLEFQVEEEVYQAQDFQLQEPVDEGAGAGQLGTKEILMRFLQVIL